MSGIFGVFNRNAESVNKDIMTDMLDSMLEWKPDDYGIWINTFIAVGHTMLWNTPESKHEHLPLHKDFYVLSADARIDNRFELSQQLELPDLPLEMIGDSEFILAAYQKWGENCPKYLLGDFSFVIWDAKQEQLFCVRDHIGIKQFYFYLCDDLFVFGNDIEGLLAHKEVSKLLDDQTIAMFLKGEGIHTKRATFFEKIKKLPPASTLTITRSDVIEKKYWRIEESPLINYNTYDEYVQKLKDLFESAVDVRLRTIYPVVSHLSGGIDSSPIAVLAARKLKKRNQKLYAFNWINVPENNEYEYESWNFSRRISESENIMHKEFDIDSNFIAKQYEERNFFTRGTMYMWKEYAVQDMSKNIGARTILSGWGGDELISNRAPNYISYLFSKRELFGVFKSLLYEKKYLKYSWLKFIKRFLRLFLSTGVIKSLRTKKSHNNNKQYVNYEFINKEFAEFMNIHQNKAWPRLLGVREKQLALYNYGHLENRIESWALSAFPKKIEYRYPLLDKRIVEFAIGIPEKLFYPQKGIERFLIKSSLIDLLPSDILWFHKYDEPKIYEVRKKQFIDTLKILQQLHENQNDHFNSKYVDYKKLKASLETLDFEKFDSDKASIIALGIQLINSIKKI